MFTDFNNLSNDSRLWLYGSETILTEDQKRVINQKLTFFLEKWESHQQSLTCSFKILENHFLIIALDESKSGAGGCSIDGLQRLIQELENKLDIVLLNRLNVFCRVDNHIKCYSTSKLKEYVDKDTLFYDLTIQKKEQMKDWLKPISNGWCSRYFY